MSTTSTDELQQELEMNEVDSTFDEADWQRRMESRKTASSILGKFLLLGWTMLAEHCDKCASPLMKLRDGNIVCKVCIETVVQSSNTNINSNVSITNVNEKNDKTVNVNATGIQSSSANVIRNESQNQSIKVNNPLINNQNRNGNNCQKNQRSDQSQYGHGHGPFGGYHQPYEYYTGRTKCKPQINSNLEMNANGNLNINRDKNENENDIKSNINEHVHNEQFLHGNNYGYGPPPHPIYNGYGHPPPVYNGYGPPPYLRHGWHGRRGCPAFGGGWKQKHHMHRVIADTVKTVLDRMSFINERMAAGNADESHEANQNWSSYIAELQSLMKFLCSVEAFKKQMRE